MEDIGAPQHHMGPVEMSDDSATQTTARVQHAVDDEDLRHSQRMSQLTV